MRDVDVALVTGGADTTEHSFEVLKPGGRLVTTIGQAPQEEAARRSVKAFGAMTHPDVDQLATIANLIDAGKVKVFMGRTFPLAEAQAALDLAQTGKQVGKIVLTVD